MSDTTLGYLLVALGIVFVLAIIFTATTRDARAARADRDEAVHPPAGVHLPPPSWLPVIMAVAAALLGAGAIFNVWVLAAGGVVLLVGGYGWFRAAGREWRHVTEAERHDGSRHD